ncbi:hypothetical protein HPP92_019077 [Vanilla planifolia]|uniref:Uncharacterized protein n=1 Tax=Vanilla planifolia TaxID=51239 RepID=A0A835UMV4_VANPL|nr:hypothetical protein HPP92_019077 [Vanilla planifolia]
MLKSTALEEVSPNLIDLSTSTTVTTSLEAPSPVDNSALTLFDPSVTITSPKKTEATIDLFSLSFSTNQSPQTPQEPPLLNQNSFSNPPSFENYPNTQPLIMSNYSQPFISKEGYAINNSYVAPWAQPVVAQARTSTSVSSNPFLPLQYAESQSGPVAAAFSVQESQSSPIFSSVVSKDPQVNVDLKTTAPSSAPKPFMPDKLFDDLIELRNPDGSLKSRNASKLLSFKGTRNEKLQKMEI